MLDKKAYLFRDTGGIDRHDGEQLYICGGRGTAIFGPIFLEVEPVYESGRRFNPSSGTNERISAYGGHLDATINAPVAGHNSRLFLSYGTDRATRRLLMVPVSGRNSETLATTAPWWAT
ncbi:hypothetical protein [Geobacter argillaceus]|uniref:hypothetical protein n=1 Tax=Geobacter argillaceus TaxID=345631 RepID=UPI00119D8B00|nr:hypothetical protein [Geobacter argillaceus]